MTVFVLCICASTQLYAADALPRVLVALYDTREEYSPRTTQIHRFLEMPANYLGYDIHYYPVNETLPTLGDDVAGVVLWFNNGTEVPEAKPYLRWLENAQQAGKKIIILENAGIGDKWRNDVEVVEQWNRVLKTIGLTDDNSWQSLTYAAQIKSQDNMLGFERALPQVLPGFADTHAVQGRGESHLQLAMDKGEGKKTYDLVVTGKGGYVAEDYAIFHVIEKGESRISQWIINPFAFLKSALSAPLAPIPDVTTLNGRRIFYSHIDGDGWNNIAEIHKYNENKTIAAEVVKKEILEAYPEFPFTVGLITADVDKDCSAAPSSERVAREIFALTNVEPASHTHTHPLFWRFFAAYSPAKEKPYLGKYPSAPQHDMFSALAKRTGSREAWDNAPDAKTGADIVLGKNDQTEDKALTDDYKTPRSYACKPFNVDDEVTGSVARVAELAPGKKVRLLQWSGDTSPFLSAIAKTREAGLYNINGGDTRFDSEYPSYSFVAPVGFNDKGERQIYSSNSNENTYTNLWTGRFFGFRYLQRTIENTEHPMRVKPVNVYFHMYSGEKDASLAALKENMEYVRKQPLIPVVTSDYAAMADGFYTAELVKEGERSWRIKNRGALGTVRFDTKADGVDFEQSRGVLGYRVIQDKLYVALDAREPEPVIALADVAKPTRAYLIESRWQVENLSADDVLRFDAHGYGAGEMRWQMTKTGAYTVAAAGFSQTVNTDADAVLAFTIADLSHGAPLTITITREDDHV